MGGSINCISRPGHTSFTVELLGDEQEKFLSEGLMPALTKEAIKLA